jgi:hypothetical protein
VSRQTSWNTQRTHMNDAISLCLRRDWDMQSVVYFFGSSARTSLYHSFVCRLLKLCAHFGSFPTQYSIFFSR